LGGEEGLLVHIYSSRRFVCWIGDAQNVCHDNVESVGKIVNEFIDLPENSIDLVVSVFMLHQPSTTPVLSPWMMTCPLLLRSVVSV
jgi:hypothetical protein